MLYNMISIIYVYVCILVDLPKENISMHIMVIYV